MMRTEDLYTAIRALTPNERLRLVERVIRGIVEEGQPLGPAEPPVSMFGLFSDEPDLIDEVTEGAMLSRENHPLRVGNDA